MLRIAVFLLVLFGLAIGFAWFAENPGSVTLKWDWFDKENGYEITLLHAVIGIAAIAAGIMLVWWVISGILHSPETFGRWRAGRRRDKGYDALSRGLVAAGAGNASLAKRLARESGKLLDDEPLVKLLDAQTALLEGKRDEARGKFEGMLENPDTQLLGLRGLFVEAEQEGNGEAAAHFANEAYKIDPETPWAALGLLKGQGAVGDWEKALKTLQENRSSGLFTKEEYSRKRAVILTALAMQEEDQDPDSARSHALAAHKLAPDLAPAAVIAARLSSRLGDLRKASKVLEASWKKEPHPDVAQAYIHLRAGDATHDRLKRAELLAGKKENHPEAHFAIAHAAIDAGEWTKARSAMEAILRSKPTERACLLMADIEEAQSNDQGRVREWLSRAVNAPRDAAWTADGFVADEWAPFSPVTGELDAFEWRVPLEQIGGPAQAVDYSQLPSEPMNGTGDPDDGQPTVIELAVAASTVSAGAAAAASTSDTSDDDKMVDVEDAVIIEAEPEAPDVEESPAEDAKVVAVEPEADTEAKADAEPVKPKSVTADADSASPFKTINLDADDDGIPDHFPDDPGEPVEPEKKKRKNFFF